jgi:hypothetical protein
VFIYKNIYLLFNENNSDINNKGRCFSVFTRQRSWIAFFVQGGPPLGRLAGKKSSSLRSGIFSAKPCHKKQPIQGTDACKIGKKHPDGIIHFKYLKNMKLQTIIRSVRLAAEGFLYLGIVLLCNKGIVPVCTIAFLLMAGNMTRLLAIIFLLAMIV